VVKPELMDAIEEVGGMLVPAAETSRDIVSWDSIAWESDGCEDIQPSFPIIKIVQRTSRQDGATKHVGDFWHSDREGEAAFTDGGEGIEIVGLVKRDTRAMFVEGEDQPVCMSADGKKPLADMPAWSMNELAFRDGTVPNPLRFAPAACNTCPFAQWSPSGEPPRCRESKVVLVERQDDKSLAQLRISGMSIRPFEQMVAKFLRPKNLPLYSKRLIVTTASRQKPQKVWEEMEFHPIALDIDEALQYAGMLREQRQLFEKSLAEESETIWQADGEGSDPVDLPFE